MAFKKTVTVAVPASVSTGAAKDISDMLSCKCSISGTFTATYKILVSYDAGTSFVQTGSDVTAASEVTIPDAAQQIKIQCSAYTSGTPVGAVGGVTA